MIRTQVYLENQTHQDLQLLARRENRSMADVTRDILKEGIHKRKKIDFSGKAALFAIANIHGKSDDPYLSLNIDHYLYGAPKKKI